MNFSLKEWNVLTERVKISDWEKIEMTVETGTLFGKVMLTLYWLAIEFVIFQREHKRWEPRGWFAFGIRWDLSNRAYIQSSLSLRNEKVGEGSYLKGAVAIPSLTWKLKFKICQSRRKRLCFENPHVKMSQASWNLHKVNIYKTVKLKVNYSIRKLNLFLCYYETFTTVMNVCILLLSVLLGNFHWLLDENLIKLPFPLANV